MMIRVDFLCPGLGLLRLSFPGLLCVRVIRVRSDESWSSGDESECSHLHVVWYVFRFGELRMEVSLGPAEFVPMLFLQ